MVTQHHDATAAGDTATAPPVAPSPGPQGVVDGRDGWVVVAATFTSTFVVFGVAYSFGSFFGPMADEFGSGRSATSLFFAFTAFAYFGLGAISGRVADRRGPRPVLLFGAVFLVAGLLATSWAPSIWLGYLTYGVGVGVGVACGYVPMVATVGGWFERHRTTALGVAVAGIGTGTLVVAPLAEWLITQVGWRQTYVYFAVAAGVILALAALGARPAPSAPSQGTGSGLRWLLRADGGNELRRFSILYMSMFLGTMALFVPFVFLPDYVSTENIDGSAGWLIGVIGMTSVAGRLGLGTLATRYPAFRLYQGSFLVLALSFLIWMVAGQSYWLLVVFTVVLGVAYGGIIALGPAVTAELFGTNGLGAVLGAFYTASGVGGLIGPPLYGLVIDHWGYSPAQVLALTCGLAGTALLTALPRQS